MEINRINRELFKKYIKELKLYSDYINNLSKLDINIWEREEVSRFEDSFVHMLSLICHEEWGTEFGNSIEYFIWDCEYGENKFLREEAECDDTLQFFHNADELWDYLISIHPELNDEED